MFQNYEVYEDEQPPQAVLKMRKKQALSQVCYKYCSSSCLPSWFEEIVDKLVTMCVAIIPLVMDTFITFFCVLQSKMSKHKAQSNAYNSWTKVWPPTYFGFAK